jgi:peptidylprolyl isomerase
MPTKRTILTIAATAALALGASACGGDEGTDLIPDPDNASQSADTGTTTTATTPAKASDPKDTSTKPTIEKPSGDPPKKLVKEDIVVGKGAAAKKGDHLTMQYVGVSWSTGEQFDASWDNGQPFEFDLGTGGVIKGWDQGIVGMKPGGRRKLIIPPDLGYGAQGNGGIAPNETLVFIVDLIAIK